MLLQQAILDDLNYSNKIKILSKKYPLPLIKKFSEANYVLYFKDDILYLHTDEFAEFYIDYLSPPFSNRIKRATANNELIARACRIKNKTDLSVIDATGGLGFDSMILAKVGFNVITIEREPVLAALLEQAFNNFLTNEKLLRPARNDTFNVKLIFSESMVFLKNLTANKYPDVIYLDPMYPQEFKSARSNKYLHLLQQLCQKNNDENELFNLALQKAKQRVVIKRPTHAPFLQNKKPNFSLKARSHRFDVYNSINAT